MASIGVVFGGPSPEHDISILTGLQSARALQEAGEQVTCLYWTKAGRWRAVPVTSEPAAFLAPEVAGASEVELAVPGGFTERRRRKDLPLALDVVLNCCHGGPGEDGSLAALLRLAGLRVTGPTPEASALLMDKLATTAVARQAGVPVIDTFVVDGGTDRAALPPPPWVAKPRFSGSSLGVEAGLDDLATAQALAATGVGRAGMILQPQLTGWQDVNVSVRRVDGEVVTSEIERPLRSDAAIYDYAGKYLTGGQGMDAAPRELPAVLPADVRSAIGAHARTLAGCLGLTGAPRIDFLWDGGSRVVLCEVNAIPGAWGNHLWEAAGLGKVALYRALVAEALAQPAPRPQWAATSDGAALRASGSIAAKLG